MPGERSLYGCGQILSSGRRFVGRRVAGGNGQQLAQDVRDLLGTARPLKDRAVLRLHFVDTGVDVDHHLPRRRRDQSLGDADQVV
jgi:hypothetical protein